MFKVDQSVFYRGEQMPLDKFVSEYRKVYQAGVELFAKYNPCDIYDCTCIKGRAICGQYNVTPKEASFCCAGCDYLTDEGCNAEALWCKAWICGHLITTAEDLKEFKEALAILRTRAQNLCRGIGGRLDLSDYIMKFYGKEILEEWRYDERSKRESHTEEGAVLQAARRAESG